MEMHVGQLAVSAELVRRLVALQFPEWAGLPIAPVSAPGTVNALFRIGDDLVVRLALHREDPQVLRSWLAEEGRASQELAAATRFRTPRLVAIGEPGEGYPSPWSVQTWLPGHTAIDEDVATSIGMAEDLAELIGDIRRIELRGRTFPGAGRGGDLIAHDEWMEECFAKSDRFLDVAPLRDRWRVMRSLPRADVGDVMNHGDLIAPNLLVADGRLTGVLDVGGLCAADPSLDVLSAWSILEAAPRRTMRRLLDCDDLEWARGQAWAFEQAMGLVWYYARSNPTMSELGRQTLRRILSDPL